MNALGRKIAKGETVVLKDGKRFVCLSGFGLYPTTSGIAIYGHYEGETEEVCRTGFDIDPKATKGAVPYTVEPGP